MAVKMTLWALQLTLAIACLSCGRLFLGLTPHPAMRIAPSLPLWLQLFLSVANFAAAAGLTLPGITRIMPWLVSWAAAGVTIVTASATLIHLAHGEIGSAVNALLFFTLALVVFRMRASARIRVTE